MLHSKNCAGLTRRDCLQLGLAGLTVGGFADLLSLRTQAAETTRGSTATSSGKRPTSCIFVWLDGGPSHYESFDPKPMAPKEIAGEWKPIATSTPGIQFCEIIPNLARISNELCIVRSIKHNQGNHGAGNHYMVTGAPPRIPVGCGAFVSFHPSLGSGTARERSAPRGLPSYFSIPEMSRSGGPNFFGAKYAPFVVKDDPNDASFRVRDVSLPEGLTDDRFIERRDLRKIVDRLPRFSQQEAGDPVAAIDTYYRQGYELIDSPEARAAFDMNSEAESVREKFGRNPFGQRCLLARRLVEAGVPWITLYSGGWDHHVDIFPTFKKMMPTIDQSVTALIEDLRDRGLLETTLVVMLGEFGRTPKINPKGGRDHWSNAMSVMFAGCGVPGGTVVGATDKDGYSAVERVLSPENFVSTIYRKLGIDPGKIYYTPQGRPTHLVSDPTPIKELMG